MFHDERSATPLAESTDAGLHTHPVFESHIKILDEVSAYIMSHPIVEDGAEEFPESTCVDRPGRKGGLALSLGVKQYKPIAGHLLRLALYDRNELHEPASDLL
jgi:hypothetical protein